MLIVLSPAKTMDYTSSLATEQTSQAELMSHSAELIAQCRQLSPAQIATLMKVSDKIAGLNAARFSQWSPTATPDNARQAILAFKGDVYSGLEAEGFSAADFTFAQRHLRMLSGLYGVLKPLDLMQAYRLEMGCKLKTARGENLYQFWGDIITEKLNETLADLDQQVLVNLASNEYFKSVNPKKLNGKIITPVFKDFKNGQYKIISFYAKKARGMMARYIIENQLKSTDDLVNFDTAGYYFVADQSDANALVFYRDAPL